MADRTVLVRLKADPSPFVRGVAQARASLTGLTKDIDKTNDRTAWLAQSALALGPAMVPLGAAATPILSGVASWMTVAAGAGSTLVLALNGVGDALEALNDYQLEPTADNFHKLQLELDRLGPAGTDFVRFLDTLEPQLRNLQMVARQGLLPGVEDGITSLLEKMPVWRHLIRDFAQGMGELTADAGAGLSGEGFTAFFDYLKRQGQPILEDMGRTFGNFVQGLANMMVAFEPLTMQFSGGLLEMSRAFADWSTNLETDQGFQGFLRYVQESGPKTLELLGAMIDAFVQIVQAAAPIGDIMLPALEAFFSVIAAIADTPIGPVFIALGAVTGVIGRSMALAAVTTGGMSKALVGLGLGATKAGTGLRILSADIRTLTSVEATATARTAAYARTRAGLLANAGRLAPVLAGVALATTDVAESTGLANTASYALMGTIAGPWGAAIGAGVGLIQDFTAANDGLEASTKAAEEALAGEYGIPVLRERLAELRADLAETEKAQDEFWDIDSSVSSNLKALHGWIFGTNDAEEASAGLSNQLAILKSNAKAGGDIYDLMAVGLGRTGAQMRVVAGDAKALSGALAELEGWFDKRAAIRQYRENLRELSKSIKDGFQRKDVDTLDAFGRSILQIASQIKSDEVRKTFLAGARAELEELATRSGPRAAAAIQKVIDKFDSKGLTQPKAPKLDLDDKQFRRKANQAEGIMSRLATKDPKPTLEVDTRQFDRKTRDAFDIMGDLDSDLAAPRVQADATGFWAIVDNVRRTLNQLNGTTATTYIRTERIGGMGGPGRDRDPGDAAEDQRIMSRGESMPVMGRGDTAPMAMQNATKADYFNDLLRAAQGASEGLKGLRRQLREAEKAVERERAQRDRIVAKMDAIRSGVDTGLRSDIFATPDAPANPWAAGASAPKADPMSVLQADIARGREFLRLVKSLKAKGLKGAPLAAILESGDIDRARLFDSMTPEELAEYSALYKRREQVLASASGSAASASFGQDLQQQTRELREANRELKAIKQAIKEADKGNRDKQDQSSDRVARAMTSAAGDARRKARRRTNG